MTQKEKLFREYVNKNNEIVVLLGENNSSSIHTIDLEHEIRVCRYKQYSVQELKDKIAWMDRVKIDTLKSLKLESFYKTEKGKKIKEDLEYQQKTLEDTIEQIHELYKFNLQILLDEICGKGYMITSFGNQSVEFAKEKDGKSIFGHSWSVYRSSWDNKVDLNYPTFGSFNPVNDSNRVDYLMALANFAKPENFQKIADWFEDFNKDLNKVREDLRIVNKNLKNPYELAA